MNVIASSLLLVFVIAQPDPGIHAALMRIPERVRLESKSTGEKVCPVPCKRSDQWPRMMTTRSKISHLGWDHTAMLSSGWYICTADSL